MSEHTVRELGPGQWHHQRFGWLESVRRAAGLSDSAKVVAHVLALDFANSISAECTPSHAAIGHVTGKSRSSVKRAVGELVKGGWIAVAEARGRGRSSGFVFLTRARIVALKGVKSDPLKGSKSEPGAASEKGPDLTRGGVKYDPPLYNSLNHRKNHRAGGLPQQGENPPVSRPPKLSTNATVIREAEDAVERLREGRADALADLKPWVLDHVRAAGLLTDAERQAAGLGHAEKGDER
jgi:hypothetical protein